MVAWHSQAKNKEALEKENEEKLKQEKLKQASFRSSSRGCNSLPLDMDSQYIHMFDIIYMSVCLAGGVVKINRFICNFYYAYAHMQYHK